MTKPVEITQREMLQDMHERLGVLEATAENQAAVLMQQSENLKTLVRINRGLIEENRRLIRVKEAFLEIIGRDALIQRQIDHQPIPWTSGEFSTTNQFKVREKSDG